MRLTAPEHGVPKLFEDYEHMRNMIFGEKLGFDGILNAIS